VHVCFFRVLCVKVLHFSSIKNYNRSIYCILRHNYYDLAHSNATGILIRLHMHLL
jgi:hypothetical protein